MFESIHTSKQKSCSLKGIKVTQKLPEIKKVATKIQKVCTLYVVFNKREVVFYQSTKGRGRSPRPFVL
jgi:hypothetical protein